MHPFSNGDTFTVFRHHIKKLTDEIGLLDNEYILKASPTELEQHFVDKVLIDPLVLHADERYIKNQAGTGLDVTHGYNRLPSRGEKIIVKGTKLDIAIPFEGDPSLWKIQPSVYSMSGYPEINILNDEVIFSVTFPDDTTSADELRAEIERNTKLLKDAVVDLKRDVEDHNKSAPDTIRKALERKRASAQSAVGAVAALGIPIKKRTPEPTFAIPTKRRERPVKRPSIETGKYEPEPALDEKEYQHILEILRSMSLVIERSPSSFASLNEEALRDHFLILLNGHYEGSATGETFNASGKTDILIRIENRNVFVAECKFWRGPKVFNSAVDQLLSYLTWRDSKCALIVFNRTKDSSSVRQKMHEIMEAHSEWRTTVTHQSEGDSRYVLVKESEPGREIIVTTQLYDIPPKE